MIIIKNFQISNYRSCKNTKIEVNTNLTTLIGINGVGKSNILNTLQLLKKIRRNRFFGERAVLDSLAHSTLTIQLEVRGKKCTLKIDIYYETDERNIDEIYTSEIKVKYYETGKRIRWQNIDPDLIEYIERARQIGKPLGRNIHLDQENLDLISYIGNISYYGATVFSDPSKCPISLELEDLRPLKFFRDSKPHEKFIHDLYIAYKSNEKGFKKYLNTVNSNGIGIVDKIEFYEHSMRSNSYKVKSGGTVKQIEKTKNIIIPSFFIDNINLSPNQLSEGTFKTLALVFYILNDECDLLIIEEPEVCVHHGLLSSIVELIKTQSKHKQIFISTHSDYILDQLQPENIVLVKKDLEKGTTAKPLSKSLSKNDYSALKDYLATSGNLGEYWKEGGFENE